MEREQAELQKALDAFANELKAQCAALESSVSQIDGLQEVTFKKA